MPCPPPQDMMTFSLMYPRSIFLWCTSLQVGLALVHLASFGMSFCSTSFSLGAFMLGCQEMESKAMMRMTMEHHFPSVTEMLKQGTYVVSMTQNVWKKLLTLIQCLFELSAMSLGFLWNGCVACKLQVWNGLVQIPQYWENTLGETSAAIADTWSKVGCHYGAPAVKDTDCCRCSNTTGFWRLFSPWLWVILDLIFMVLRWHSLQKKVPYYYPFSCLQRKGARPQKRFHYGLARCGGLIGRLIRSGIFVLLFQFSEPIIIVQKLGHFLRDSSMRWPDFAPCVTLQIHKSILLGFGKLSLVAIWIGPKFEKVVSPMPLFCHRCTGWCYESLVVVLHGTLGPRLLRQPVMLFWNLIFWWIESKL